MPGWPRSARSRAGRITCWAARATPTCGLRWPRQPRRYGPRAVWRSLAREAGPTELGTELPDGPRAGPLSQLCTVQYLILRMLRRANHPGHPRPWELAAAGTLCAGLGSETIRIAGSFGAGRRDRLAGRRLRALVENSTGRERDYLTHNARVLDLTVSPSVRCGRDPR